MKGAAFAALTLLALVAGACGKVGDPRPPIVRVPRAIGDLRAVQSGYRVILSWTNPGQYIDNNAATDLSAVRIFRDGVEAETVPLSGPGQAQSREIDVTGALDSDLTFSVQVDSQRGRSSAMSSSVSIHVIDVPGVPQALAGVFDQLRVQLTWEPPQHAPDLVARYIVRRGDRPQADAVDTTEFLDGDYELGKDYTYTVVAVRASDGQVPGLGEASVTVRTADTRPPALPEGLRIEALGDGVLLQWQPNVERDFKEYWVYRSDTPEPIARTPANAFRDADYRTGLSYQLLAVDVFDNQSERTAPLIGP